MCVWIKYTWHPACKVPSAPFNWVLTYGVLGNKTFISLINVETHGSSLSSCVYWGVVIIVWLDKKRGAVGERPHSHCAIVPVLLVVICRALHLITIRQTADAERLKREICCLAWAYGCLSGLTSRPINTGFLLTLVTERARTPEGSHAAGLPNCLLNSYSYSLHNTFSKTPRTEW